MVAVVSLVLQTSAIGGHGQPAVSLESAVRHAVVETVKARMGQGADVRIETLQFKATPGDGVRALIASPEPGARLGRQNRFTLQWVVQPSGRASSPAPGASPATEHGVRRLLPVAAGYAVASVFVAVEHVRASRPIARGEACDEADLVFGHGEVGAVLVQRLPRLSEVLGCRVLRNVMADEVVTRTALSVRAMVKSGDVVAVRAAADGVSVEGLAVAQQSGSEGDVIRAVNSDSRRTLKVRVVAPGRVEVVQ